MRVVPTQAGIFLALCTLWAHPAAAQTATGAPRVLIDRRLQEREVYFVGIDDRLLRYLDSGGLPRSEPIADYLALLPGSAEAATPRRTIIPADTEPQGPPELSAASPPAAMLELTDGQRFAGLPTPSDPGAAPQNPDTIRWTHPVLGPLEIKLDQVRRIRLNQPADEAPIAPAADDIVILSNGDRLAGFIESIGATLHFSVAGKDKAVEIPLDRIQELVLANPAQRPPPHAIMAYFRDGSIIACRALNTNRVGELTINRRLQDSESPDPKPSEAPAHPSLRLDDLLAAAFDAAAMVPLATIPPATQEPAPGRRWTRPARAIDPHRTILAAADITIPGPMTVEWDLPAGATRILSTAELPRQNWTWGNCILVVSIVPATPSQAAETELLRQRLSADQPAATLSAALPDRPWPRRLRIRLEPGDYGPIQDQIILRRPLLLIEPKPT